MRSASAIVISRTEAIARLPQIVTCAWLQRKNRGTKGYKGSNIMQAL